MRRSTYGCLKPMAKEHNAKNCQQRLTCRTCGACHPAILHDYFPKVKTGDSQSTANPECSSRNAAEEENVMCVSVNSKFYVEVIQNCKKISEHILYWITVVKEVSSKKIYSKRWVWMIRN